MEIILWALGTFSLPLTSDSPSPEFALKSCELTNKHVAVQRVSADSYVVHIHLNVSNMKKSKAFAQVRCLVRERDMEPEVLHVSSKEVAITVDQEKWSFFLTTPRFVNQDAVYQVEYGAVDVTKGG